MPTTSSTRRRRPSTSISLCFRSSSSGFRRVVERGLAQGDGSKDVEDIFTDQVKQSVKEKSYAEAALSVGATKEEIQALIDKAIEEGQSVQQLAKAINDQFDVDSRMRSLRIARTELTDTINDGTLRTLVAEGYAQKEWRTVVDGRERESHALLNGEVVGIHEQFQVGDGHAMAPGDANLPPGERINCRCALTGAGISEDRKRVLDEQFLRLHGALEKRLVIELRRAFERQRDRVLAHFPSQG